VSRDYNTPLDASDSRLEAEALNGTLGPEQLLECLLFVADEPVPIPQLAQALELPPRAVEAALESLEAAYQRRGLRLQRWQDRVQLTTAPAAAAHIERFLGLSHTTRLSHAALETLAIIAYQQPVTRPHIEAVRGVNSDSVIKSLLTKGLIEETGRGEGVGRPILYRTTPEFLQHFGLTSVMDLPPLNLPEAFAQVQAAAAAQEPEQDGASEPGRDSLQEQRAKPAEDHEAEPQLEASAAPPAEAAPEAEGPAVEVAPPASEPEADFDRSHTGVTIAESRLKPEPLAADTSAAVGEASAEWEPVPIGVKPQATTEQQAERCEPPEVIDVEPPEPVETVEAHPQAPDQPEEPREPKPWHGDWAPVDVDGKTRGSDDK
jgi:segregation and condensation protein B